MASYIIKNPDLLKEAVKPVVDWLQENGTPHDTIIIRQDGAELVVGVMSVPFKVRD